MYLALMFPSRFPWTMTASQFSTSATITTPLPTTSTLLVPGGTIEGGPAGFDTSILGGIGAGLGTANTFGVDAAAAGAGDEDVVPVITSLGIPRNDMDFFLNMMNCVGRSCYLLLSVAVDRRRPEEAGCRSNRFLCVQRSWSSCFVR